MLALAPFHCDPASAHSGLPLRALRILLCANGALRLLCRCLSHFPFLRRGRRAGVSRVPLLGCLVAVCVIAL
eukprot:3945076-Prymnesium_polylepis.1